jgi:hypothetical protein
MARSPIPAAIVTTLISFAISAHAGLDRYGNALGEDENAASPGSYAWVILIGLPVLTFVSYSWLKKAKPDWSHAASFNAAFLGSLMAIVIAVLMIR